MKPVTFIRSAIVAGFALLLMSFTVPTGWRISGSAADKYEIGVVKVIGHESKCSGIIKSVKKTYFTEEYALLLQTVSAKKYAGKAVKLSGYVKTRGVEVWSGLMLRVDKEGVRKPLAFDNMHDRPLKGNSDWRLVTIELVVPPDATGITFGGLLHGAGQIWFDDLKLEVTGNAIPVTSEGISAPPVVANDTLRIEPVNMDFEG